MRAGFYTRVEAGLAAHPRPRALPRQPSYVDPAGHPLPWGAQASEQSGLLAISWAEHIFVQLRFACAGIVVRRSVYERLGGFDAELRYCLDWDMWQRIAVEHPDLVRAGPARLLPDSSGRRPVDCSCRDRTCARSPGAWSGGRRTSDRRLGPQSRGAPAPRTLKWALRGAWRLLRQGRPLVALGQLWGTRHLCARGDGLHDRRQNGGLEGRASAGEVLATGRVRHRFDSGASGG